MGRYVTALNKRMQLVDKRRYTREQYQSFMTGPEWLNVEISEDFAIFLREGHSMFQFPFFAQISEIWKVFYQSYVAARKYNSPYQILFSDYMVMDLFVVLFTTLESIPKGVVSFLFYPFLAKENNSEMQLHLDIETALTIIRRMPKK